MIGSPMTPSRLHAARARGLGFSAAARRAGWVAALLLQAHLAFALDVGPLVLRRDNQPGLLGHFRISDQNPLDASQLTIRLAHGDAYAALGLRYERALSSTVLSVEPTMDSGLTVSLRPLPPVTADNGPLDVVVVIFEGTKLTTRLFRVDLRSSRQEFAGIDPTLAAPLAAVTAGLVTPPRGAPAPSPAPSPAPAVAPVARTQQSSASSVSIAAAPPTRDATSADVARAIGAWAAAWARRDVEAYANAYLPDYHVGHASHGEWLTQRRARILARRDIEVALTQVMISVDGARAEARFVQRYRGDQLRQTNRKRLALTLQGGVWLISDEAEL